MQADAYDRDSDWGVIEDAVITLAPKVLVVHTPLSDQTQGNLPNPLYELESKLHDLKYTVDAETTRSAAYGGHTDQRG